jgi:hypothetical protein
MGITHRPPRKTKRRPKIPMRTNLMEIDPSRLSSCRFDEYVDARDWGQKMSPGADLLPGHRPKRNQRKKPWKREEPYMAIGIGGAVIQIMAAGGVALAVEHPIWLLVGTVTGLGWALAVRKAQMLIAGF